MLAEMNPLHIFDLPEDVLILILRKLPVTMLIKVMRYVNKTFARLCEQKYLYHTVKIVPSYECLYSTQIHTPWHLRPCACDVCLLTYQFIRGGDEDYRHLAILPVYRPYTDGPGYNDCDCPQCKYPSVSLEGKVNNELVSEILDTGGQFNAD